jgi:copper transport protein
MRGIGRAILLLLAVLGAPSAARAHAALVASEPADGARLESPPAAVTLTFNEPVRPIALRLVDGAGRELAAGAESLGDGTRLRLALPAPLPEGAYMVSWRVVSIDAHPVEGSIAFGLGVAVAATDRPTAAHHSADARLVLVVLLRLVQDLGLLAAAGLALFLWLVLGAGPTPMRTMLHLWLRRAALFGALASGLGVGARGLLLGDLPAAALLGGAAWRLGIVSTAGRGAALAIAGALLLLAAARRPPLAIAGAALIALSFATTGHAATAPPRWLAAPALGLHALVVAFWLGSLLALGALAARLPAVGLAPIVDRFARLAVPGVLALLALGLVLAALQLRAPEALWSSAYGRLLLGKLGLVAALLGLALYNNRVLTPRLRRGDEAARTRLRATIRRELACIVAILAVTVTLGQTPPPRAVAMPLSDRAELATGDGERAMIEVRSGGAGQAALVDITLSGRDGAPLHAEEVRVQLASPALGIAPLTRAAIARAPGRYEAPIGVPLPPGAWRLRIDARLGDFDLLVLETELELR